MKSHLEIDDIAEVIGDAIREATAPLKERIARLESQLAALEDEVTKP